MISNISFLLSDIAIFSLDTHFDLWNEIVSFVRGVKLFEFRPILSRIVEFLDHSASLDSAYPISAVAFHAFKRLTNVWSVLQTSGYEEWVKKLSAISSLLDF